MKLHCYINGSTHFQYPKQPTFFIYSPIVGPTGAVTWPTAEEKKDMFMILWLGMLPRGRILCETGMRTKPP
ncbi:hypothetical protein PHAVU_002G077500 [Phaseolus vulgaris]|uniref:Uncharacterized protein n=1 Tax=Phaseolus vulgaris TaxID=3885 RepID=V7CJI8_PHAVU|nr:hypothetical protein PHAVU_002G077500g [Phaseolus vulgaris]ESW29523.1 hypothetical protein PHAVU_002G077500g [Phaseolus vulgaris]